MNRFPVAGTVLIDGKPLSSGSIQFVPKDGRPVGGKISGDGSFRLVNRSVSNDTTIPGVAKGTYKIAISSSVVVDEDDDKMHRNIPKHYADFRTSNLEAEITGPQEDMVIELTWEGFEDPEATESAELDTDENADDSTQETEASQGESGASTEE
ncbi:MAG: hypothetical protein ACR2NM_10710 [Bythopirellula sp.]